MERIIEMQFDKLIIGADLSALSFAYIHKIPIIYLRKLEPFYPMVEESILYEKLIFILSLSKYIAFSDLVSTLRIEDNNSLTLTTKESVVAKIKFNYLYINDDYKVVGLPLVSEPKKKSNLVLDYFSCEGNRALKKHITKEQIIDNSKFAYSVNFDGKFIISPSYIDQENLNEFDHSSHVVRLKLSKWIKQQYPELKIKLEPIQRLALPLWKNSYKKLPENFLLLREDHRSILSVAPVAPDTSIELLHEHIGITF